MVAEQRTSAYGLGRSLSTSVSTSAAVAAIVATCRHRDPDVKKITALSTSQSWCPLGAQADGDLAACMPLFCRMLLKRAGT